MPFFLSMATSKEIKEKVVAFRLTEAQWTDLKEYFDKHPVGGIRSVNTFCRKLALDASHDRLLWRNKKEQLLSPEAILAMDKMGKNGNGKKARPAPAAA